MNIEKRLEELKLPAEVLTPAGAYAKAVILDGYAHLSVKDRVTTMVSH